MALELVCGADFWCNRHCRTSPVVLEGFWGQVWPKISRKPEKTEFRVANEPLRPVVIAVADISSLASKFEIHFVAVFCEGCRWGGSSFQADMKSTSLCHIPWGPLAYLG